MDSKKTKKAAEAAFVAVLETVTEGIPRHIDGYDREEVVTKAVNAAISASSRAAAKVAALEALKEGDQ